MKYFYKNDDRYSGFCATLNNAINVCYQYYQIFKNNDLYIDIPELNNIFEFNKSKENNESDFNHIWQTSNFDNSSNAHTLCNKDKTIEKKTIFENFFKLKNIDFYENEVSKFINDKTLGIHIRGTDKVKEVPAPSIKNIINYINDMLEKNDIDNIYLATDDKYYQDIIKNEFGDKIKWRVSKISEDGKPIHFVNDRSIINVEVMTDVYLLSKCKYLLYCFSNVSYTALIMGIDNFKEIKCINI